MGELGITCVGKNTRVPASFNVAHSCILGTDLKESHFKQFENKIIPAGTHLGYSKK